MKRKNFILFAVVFLLIIGALFFGGRSCLKAKSGFFYPTDVDAIGPIEGDFKAILADFEAVLKEKNETVYRSLNPGLGADDIRNLEDEYRVVLPEEVRMLYMWHDGCGDFENAFENGTIIPGHWFVPLKQSLEWNRELNQSEGTFVQNAFLDLFAGHMNGWFVLLDDGCGDGYFYDPKRPADQGYAFYHLIEMRHYVFFSSLKNMFKAFTECYQKDAYKFDAEIKLEDYQEEEEVMSKYGVSVD